MDMKRITIQKQGEDGFKVLRYGLEIKTHRGDSFPSLQEDIATILADDLNYIYENVKHPDERMSLVYCVLSTLYHTQKTRSCQGCSGNPDPYNLSVEIVHLIQWDHCFRISANPMVAIPQRWANDPVVSFLGEDWVDLPMNFCSTTEEMMYDLSNPGFVPRKTIKRFEEVLNNFTRAQRFSVTLVGDSFGDFSVSLTTLLIAKLVSPEDYFTAMLIFRYGKSGDRFTKKEKLEMGIFINKMNNLLKALDSEGIKQLI